MTVTRFGYRFIRFYFSVFPSVLVSNEKINQTLKTVLSLTTFPNTANFVKNTPLRVVFSTLFSVFGNVSDTRQVKRAGLRLLLQKESVTDYKHYKEQVSQYSKTINECSPKTPAKTRFSQYEYFSVELELRERCEIGGSGVRMTHGPYQEKIHARHLNPKCRADLI